MIVLRHNDTVYIAKSCWGFRDLEARRTGVPDTENICMWHPQKRKNRLMATSCSGRFADIIRYENIFPSKFDQKHLIFESYDKMVQLADRFGLRDGNFIPARTVFAEENKAYIVYGDGGHIELEDIYVSSCEDEAVMALYDLKGIDDPHKFIKEAFKTVEDIRRYVMFPVIVMNTKNNKIEIINR